MLNDDIVAICTGLNSVPAFADVELLKCIVHRERGTYQIRLLIDRAAGMGTEVCEAVARYVERRIEELPPPVPLYHLEVASAGVDRPLLTREHYERYRGREVNIITSLRIRNRTEFTGVIAAVEPNAVTVDDRYAGRTPIPFEAIKRAKLVYHPEDDLKKSKSS